MVEYMDTLVGRIVRKLDEFGLRENTLLLFFSDNGSPREITSHLGDKEIRGGKGFSTDAGTRVPLIANWKGTAPAGVVCNDLIDCSDFLPTLMELAETPLPEGETFDGRSFFPQLHDERGNPRHWLFFHHDPLPGWSKDGYTLQRWAQDKRWKLYDDGRFFDVRVDVLEENSITLGECNLEAEEARQKLQSVLDRMH